MREAVTCMQQSLSGRKVCAESVRTERAHAAVRCGSSRRSRPACCHARQARLSALQTPLKPVHALMRSLGTACALASWWLMVQEQYGLMHAPAARARPAGRWPLGAFPCLLCSRLPIAEVCFLVASHLQSSHAVEPVVYCARIPCCCKRLKAKAPGLAFKHAPRNCSRALCSCQVHTCAGIE